MNALEALEQDSGVVALSAMEARINMSDATQLSEYVLHGLDIGTRFGDRPEDVKLLAEVIHAVADGIQRDNMSGFTFDPSSTPCGICNRTGHTFADCNLLRDKGKVTEAFTKLVMALKKLLRLVSKNLGTPSSLASQDLATINALDHHHIQPPSSSRQDKMMMHFANSIVDIHSMLRSQRSSSRDAGNATDNDSASTSSNNYSESLNAVQQYSSSGRRSDFRFGQL